MFKGSLYFPLAAAINFFSITGLVILSGLFGRPDLAAEFAVVQGAVLAVFLSLSGNARSIILAAPNAEEVEKNVFYFRLMVVIPASIGVYYLAISTVAPAPGLVLALIFRKCAEWLAELQLAHHELDGNSRFAAIYLLVNLSLFVMLSIAMLVPSWEGIFYWVLIGWALAPAAFACEYLRYIRGLAQYGLNFSRLIPHMGSTVAIGVSTYVFRVLVVILAGKILAGQMFTAYALGGVLSSLYVYAVGPSLLLGEKTHRIRLLLLAISLCFVLGTIAIAAQFVLGIELYSPYFLLAIGLSFIGGGIMIVAQNQRLYIIQRCNGDVFVPDAASNIILISSVPFVFFVFGDTVFAVLFLWSAILNLSFYGPIAMRTGQPRTRTC